MTETQKRIKAYKELLPGLKERVAAVAILLAMSVAMMTSATFAWLTISRRPELTAAQTTIAANGNLEVALAYGDGTTVPGESKVGDSSANEDQSVFQANNTWGNLINLSDEAYGLENLTMRPAQLNTASLLESPLYGAVYGGDGRITQLSSNFGYATWVLPEGDKPGYFGVSENFGVRAISSTKIEAVGAEAKYYNMLTTARNKNLAAANMYTALGNNKTYMQSLATMMGLYMTARMNPDEPSLNNPDCAVSDIQNLRDMYAAFLECFDAEADAMAALANLALFLQHGDNYTPYTAEMICNTTAAKLKAEGIQITQLDQFIKDRDIIISDLAKLQEIATSGSSLKWQDSGLNQIVNNLVNVGACTIGANNTPISSIGASNAASYLSGTQEAKITNGILYRFEERTGGYIQVKNLSISAKVKRMGVTIPASVKANIQTTAPRDYNLFTNDLTYTEGLNDGTFEGGIPVAEDTYGLAVDLWVRTNAEGSYLTLEGNLITESEMIRAMGKDANGNEVELYTVTLTTEGEDGESTSYDMDLYQVADSAAGESSWRSAQNHSTVTEEELQGQTPVAKMVEKVTVLGYEGENRVWDESKLLSSDATTQGSGSCYVYYADTPEDQARSLKLLEAFNVAFVDEEGKLMATAKMDTAHYYAENGRVIVPLALDPSNSINLGEDHEGTVTYAITPLEKNVATRITALVYLDGTKLTNQDVLSAADIQGQLNIQFGSNGELKPIDNEDLENKERRVSATIDKTSFDYDTHTGDMISNVTVHVDGDEPSTVTAFFLRTINAAQGSREEKMTFTKNDAGDWVASYTFDVPGTYVLRTVQLDGMDYDLAIPPEVKVTGFALEYLTCDEAVDKHISVLTAANTSPINMRLKFSTDDPDKLPKSVQGRFLRSDGTAVNINFTLNPTNQVWTGSANFLTSGEYTMQYLVLDGEYVELEDDYQLTANVTLGMRVAIYTTSPHKFKYVPSEMADNEKLLAMEVKILDNANQQMPGMTGVKLTYGMKGSGIKSMDTDLTWNGTSYVGELATEGPGIWQFSRVEVGGNVLTTATTSPTFTIQSPEPPEYVEHRTNSYQYVPNTAAAMNVILTNSSAATVQARIVDAKGTEYWVDGTIGTELTTGDDKPANYWNFVVPRDVNNYQDGNWTLTDVKMWDVFAADGSAYTEEEPLTFDLSDTNNKTKVVSRVYVTFPTNMSADFGKDASGNVIGTFMQEHTVSGLSVQIHDFEGQKISGISNVKLDFTYGNNSQSYGGYTSDQLNNALADFTIALADSGDGATFTQSGTQTLRYAGSYTTKFSYAMSISGQADQVITLEGDKLPANAPKITVWSKAPTVTIDSISPSGGHQSMAVSGNNSKLIGVNSVVTGNTVTIYAEKTNKDNGTINTTPRVTLRINDLGNAQSANMKFTASGGGTVYMYTDTGMSGRTDTYSWTSGSTTYSLYIGQYKSSRTCSSMTYEGAGTLTSNSYVTVIHDNVEYTFAVNPITIINNNPPY